MKKRDIFWLKRLFLIFIIILIFGFISIYNIVHFTNTYILDEKYELNTYKQQIEWVITPLLKNNDIQSLEKYAKSFQNNNKFSFEILDADKNLIISSKGKNQLLNNSQKQTNKNYIIRNLYINALKNKPLEKTSELKIENKTYFIKILLSQEFVINSVIQAQENIILIFCVGMFCLILGIIHIFSSIRNSFNILEESIIQIARGEFSTDIELPQNGLLKELSLAIMRMTNKLKTQIIRMKQLEKYRADFVSNISHEIKTPITAINSAVELIETENDINDLQRECFDIIKFQTKSINSLVSDILSLSEIDLEKTNGHKNFKIIKLNNTVQEAINNIGIRSNIKFNYNRNEDIEVFAIENLVITAISNLLSNAIKYSCSEEIEVNLFQDSKIILEVKDYGIGIPKEHIPRIFERFYRIDKNRSRQNGGTGLGLAIVKHIIELHNWEIEVESEINKGTTFRIII